VLRPMRKKQDNPQQQNNALQSLRKKIIIQAIIAIQTIVITVAVVFGMSAAWYTNVLQTSGLQFEAAAWGFTGEVVISEEPIQASPGQSGIIGLNVSNDGDEIIDVAVRVSKEQMDVNMRQRLFFYVDAATTRNEETMERVYINTRDSYTYTVLSHSDLVLTQERANDVPLKWQWVYDMQGYYFLGTVTTQAGADNTEIVVPDVEDYLRPVEYDLDSATFEEGMLATVGEQTVEEFLEALSETDGYEKPIEATEMPGYYQLDVDENGYGIWIYLCNWAEIQQATTYDSQLGQAAADAIVNGTVPTTFKARLTVVGQLSQSEHTEVTTVEQLQDMLSSGGMLQLQKDLELTEALTVAGGEKTVLDLNGNTITGPAEGTMLTLTDAANLIIMNGEILAQDAGKDVISVSNSTLTLSGVKISGEGDDAIDISDENAEADSCVRIFESEIDVAGCAVYVRGNGATSEGRNQVIVENSLLTSGYITIMGNGTESYWGTSIQVYNSTLKGYYATIYQPQSDSITKVTGSTLEGGTGVAIKGGDLEIVSSTVKGTFPYTEPKFEGSGFTDTGDAVYVDCSYAEPMEITISGDSIIESTNALAVRVFVPEDGTDCASVVITGGTFSSDISAFVPTGYTYDPATGKVTADPVQEEAENG